MTTSLTLGAFSPSVVLRVARRTGRLAEAGLKVSEVSVQSSPGQFRSLLDGALDAALTSPDNVVAYRFCPDNPLGATADVQIVSAVDRGLGLGLYGRPGMQTADQLRGARLGVDVATSGFAFALFRLAESLGVQPTEYQTVTLGSTPRRLAALLASKCDATMLNAGSELKAEAAGCRLLAGLVDVCKPYVGTVVAIAGDTRLSAANDLASALAATTGDIVSGAVDDVAVQEATSALGLPALMARRYLEVLKDPDTGLVLDGRIDMVALRTVVELRRRYLPQVVDGVDVLSSALDVAQGLLSRPDFATPVQH